MDADLSVTADDKLTGEACIDYCIEHGMDLAALRPGICMCGPLEMVARSAYFAYDSCGDCPGNKLFYLGKKN